MPRRTRLSDSDCAIAQALEVVGDWWTLLIVRDIARGRHRFEELRTELGISRKVLTERLSMLVDSGILRRERYRQHPPRDEYRLTELGHGLLPVLASLQDFGDRWLLGDGTLTATAETDSPEANRVHALKGTTVPRVDTIDPIAPAGLTVLYFYPATGLFNAEGIPGGPGCTVESCTYRDRLAEFAALGATVHGVSTQRPDEQAEFAAANRIQFRLFSDADLRLATALRLPTFRAAGTRRIKRLTLIADAERRIREVLYPIPDPGGSVAEALAACQRLAKPGGKELVADEPGGPPTSR